MKREKGDLLELFLSSLVPADTDEPTQIEQKVTEEEALLSVYDKFSLRLPPLFAQMLLSYRWKNASTSQFELHDNPDGSDLSGFVAAICADKILFDSCLRNKLLIFGKSTNSYNPICFHCICSSPRSYPIVEVDHESILTPGRELKIVHTLAETFEKLISL